MVLKYEISIRERAFYKKFSLALFQKIKSREAISVILLTEYHATLFALLGE